MWHEIKEKAKLVSLMLFKNIKTEMAEYMMMDDKVGLHKPTSILWNAFLQPASENILNRWKCVIDLFIEKRFLWNDSKTVAFRIRNNVNFR